MEVLIEETLVVTDDRIHGAFRMSQWVSISDLIKKKSARCAENSHIPSKDLVRLQFIPKKTLYTTKCLKRSFPSLGTTQNTTRAIT